MKELSIWLICLRIFCRSPLTTTASSDLKSKIENPHAGKKSPRRRPTSAPLIDYGGTHPFELMAKDRELRTADPRLRDLGVDDYNPEIETSDPNDIPPEFKFHTDSFQPVRIRVDYGRLVKPDGDASFEKKNAFLRKTVIPAAVKFWNGALALYPVRILFVQPESCSYATEDDRAHGFTRTDVMVWISSEVNCAVGEFAAADSCDWDQYDRPIAGVINFCYGPMRMEEDGSVSESTKSVAIATAIHEMGHVLGFRSREMAWFHDIETGLPRTSNVEPKSVKCLNGETKEVDMPGSSTLQEEFSDWGVRFFQVVTPRVQQVVRNHFNCQTLSGARLENQPTGGDCFGDHFEERLFFDEMMSSTVASEKIPEFLSPLTLAWFEDSGWYKANYTMARGSHFGRGAGCEFVEQKCIDNGAIPSYSEHYFCNTRNMDTFQCDPTHTTISNCDLEDYANFPNMPQPPPVFQYFEQKTWGARSFGADYCPTWTLPSVSCKASTPPTKLKPQKQAGEVFGPNSRCFNSNYDRPFCLETLCNTTSGKIDVFVDGVTVTCDVEGQMIPINLDGTMSFECPRVGSMCPELTCPSDCSARGICDYSSERPTCNCHDKNQTDPNCSTFQIIDKSLMKRPEKSEESKDLYTADSAEDDNDTVIAPPDLINNDTVIEPPDLINNDEENVNDDDSAAAKMGSLWSLAVCTLCVYRMGLT